MAILSSWLIHWDVIGREKIDITGGIRSVIELYYPYFTEKGLKSFKEHFGEEFFQSLGEHFNMKNYQMVNF